MHGQLETSSRLRRQRIKKTFDIFYCRVFYHAVIMIMLRVSDDEQHNIWMRAFNINSRSSACPVGETRFFSRCRRPFLKNYKFLIISAHTNFDVFKLHERERGRSCIVNIFARVSQTLNQAHRAHPIKGTACTSCDMYIYIYKKGVLCICAPRLTGWEYLFDLGYTTGAGRYINSIGTDETI